MTTIHNILDVKVAQYNDLSTAWKTEETFGSRKGKRYLGVSKTCRPDLWPTVRPVREVWRVLSPEVKRPECEADYSTFSSQVKNAWTILHLPFIISFRTCG